MANSASDIKSAAQSEKIGSPYLAAVRCRFSLIAIYSKFGKQRTLENDAKLKLPRVKVKDVAKKSAKTCCFGSKGKLLQLLRLRQTAFFYFFASELSPAFCSQTIACLEKQNKKNKLLPFCGMYSSTLHYFSSVHKEKSSAKCHHFEFLQEPNLFSFGVPRPPT